MTQSVLSAHALAFFRVPRTRCAQVGFSYGMDSYGTSYLGDLLLR